MEKCFWCEGTGKFKKPRDVKKYDEVFDRYDKPGFFTMGECREKALKEVGYDLIKCPKCNGTGEYDINEVKKISVLKEKFGIRYYAELGIIDLFGLSLSKDEVKERVNFDQEDSYGCHWHSFYENIDILDIDNMEKEIRTLIKDSTGEEPIVIRYFSVPDFVNLGFDLYPIAKISNNGSTFVFSKGTSIFEYLNEVNGYAVLIEEI